MSNSYLGAISALARSPQIYTLRDALYDDLYWDLAARARDLRRMVRPVKRRKSAKVLSRRKANRAARKARRITRA